MAEIKTPLVKLEPNETFTADEDGAFVITERHSHADVMRYIVDDIGEDAGLLAAAVLAER